MESRLTKLRSEMKKQIVDAVFLSSVPNIFYLTDFSGFSKEDRDAFLLITQKNQYIFTHGIYKEAAKLHTKDFALVEMKRENPTGELLSKLISKHKIKKLGFEALDLRVSEYQNVLKFVNKKILKPINLVGKLRIIKTRDEIRKIKKACQLGDKTYSYILKYVRMNISEKQLAYRIDDFIRANNAQTSFPTIVAFGSNAAHPHHVPTDKKLSKNNFVLMDFGVKLNNYCSDMSRSVFFGKANKKQKHTYQTVLESQQKAIDTMYHKLVYDTKPKINAMDIDKIARDHIISKGYPTIPHSLGHGIGIEVHELPHLSPHSNEVIEDGMVFSIEPGIYLLDDFGVRIEDLFAIENNKLIPLTHSPKKLIEI